MAESQSKKMRLSPTAPAAASLPRLAMPQPEAMDCLTTSQPASAQPHHQPQPQPQPPRRRLHFPASHGKSLAQLYDWFMALLKQHPSLEPVMREGRRQPYVTVNPQADAYSMLVGEGFQGIVMVPADLHARQQMVIIHCVPAWMNVDLMAIPEGFVWLKRRVVGSVARPQLLGLVEGAVPSSVHLVGMGHFRVEPYTAEPDLCGHCCRFGHQEWKCRSAPRCRYCAGNHQSSRCLEKIRAGARVPRLCCNCGGDHNAHSRVCPARPRPCREPQPDSSPACPPRVVFQPASAAQHNAFPRQPVPASQPSALPPSSSTPASTQPPLPHIAAPSAGGAVSHQPAGPAGSPTPQAGETAILRRMFRVLSETNATLAASNARAFARQQWRRATARPHHRLVQPQPASAPVQSPPLPAPALPQPASPLHRPQPVPQLAPAQPQPALAQLQPASALHQPQPAPAQPLPVSALRQPAPAQPQSVPQPTPAQPQPVRPNMPAQAAPPAEAGCVDAEIMDAILQEIASLAERVARLQQMFPPAQQARPCPPG